MAIWSIGAEIIILVDLNLAVRYGIVIRRYACEVNTEILTDFNLAVVAQTAMVLIQQKKNFTNHSVRKTVVMKLKKAGVASRDITAITGHKNEESLKSYEENSHQSETP